MATQTGIGWTDHTYNPWWGCTKMSPACDNCYAEAMTTKFKKAEWGPGAPRYRVKNLLEPLTWNRAAEKAGVRRRVFTLSMGDVMDGEVPSEWRDELWSMIDDTPHLDWQLLTKRPENYRRFLPKDGFKHKNVWFGTTTEDQRYYDLRWPTMMKLKERFPDAPLWISYEPALGPLSLSGHAIKPDWVIFGGESGKGYRAMDTAWAEAILAECRDSGVAFFMKQMAGSNLGLVKKIIPANLQTRQWPNELDRPFAPTEVPVALKGKAVKARPATRIQITGMDIIAIQFWMNNVINDLDDEYPPDMKRSAKVILTLLGIRA